MNVLWAHSFNGSTRLRNGATLRVLNLSHGLVRSGTKVFIAGISETEADRLSYEKYGDELVVEGYISGYSQLHYSYSYSLKSGSTFDLRRKIAFRLLFGYPPLVNRLLKPFQTKARREFRQLLGQNQIDMVILSDRRLLFLMEEVGSVPVVTDLIDSEVLAARRRLRLLLKAGKWLSIPGEVQRVVWAYLEERHYGKRAVLNLLASPIDRQSVARVTGRPAATLALLNGIEISMKPAREAKIPGRMIFSGNMNFEPNHSSVIWFIDDVLPFVLKGNPSARLVIAGANPQPELIARKSANVEILGFVEDIAKEIAQSEIAVTPMISGGGFKNKTLEALMAGTFVASTSMGVEFLPEAFRGELLVSDDPAELAGRIVDFLRRPEEYRMKIEQLQDKIVKEFSWDYRAEELRNILEDANRSSSV
jgi:glycosyltransferase involved in cell wall biosynthesis